MRIRIKSVPQQLDRNARKFKHAFGGPLVDDITESEYKNIYGIGSWLKKGVKAIMNAAQVGAVAESPAVMTAAGYRINNQGKVVQDRQNSPDVKILRGNLFTLGEMGATAPTLIGDIETAYQAVRHPTQTVKAIKSVFKKRTNSDLVDEAVQLNKEENSLDLGPNFDETNNAAEKGRQSLLDWIKSSYYKERLNNEPLYNAANVIVDDASAMIENVPLTIKDRSLIVNQANGSTVTRPAVLEKSLSDGTKIYNLNTGLDVSIASDLGKAADDTALHELLHYMTANSKGSPVSKAGELILDRGWIEPTQTYFDALNIIHKNRSKGWQNYILDQNDMLLPQYDSVVKMVMETPEKAKSALVNAGRTKEEATEAIKALQDRYSYWYDIQEQRAHLQELFLSKIKPNLKNPNDATEIETYLIQHPEILENSIPYQFIQEVRPGSFKQYIKYFASALSTLPFINNLAENK